MSERMYAATADETIRRIDDMLVADEDDLHEVLLGASLRGDRQALTEGLIALCNRRGAGSLHGERIGWLLRLLTDPSFGWSTFPAAVLDDAPADLLDAMIFDAARMIYGDLAASPSRAS